MTQDRPQGVVTQGDADIVRSSYIVENCINNCINKVKEEINDRNYYRKNLDYIMVSQFVESFSESSKLNILPVYW